MTIDHVGYILFPGDTLFRLIGRLSFPIFAFLIIQGYKHTHSFWKYFLTLLIFSLVSQTPSIFGADIPLNIFFTLSFGLLSVKTLDSKFVNNCQLNILIRIFIIFIIINTADLFNFDYGGYGICMILTFHIFERYKIKKLMQIPLYGLLSLLSNFFQSFSIFSLFFINTYNGKQGYYNKYIKYGFYVYYPLHLIILNLILQIHGTFN
ncbi:MAG: TraX family protein [Mycoplasmatales bacterium]